MSWICRTCGGDLRIKVTKISTDVFMLDKKGELNSRPSKKDSNPLIKCRIIFCKRCNQSWANRTKIENVGVWEE